jgi:hypothetical protein
MRSGSAAESTPAPQSGPARSDPAPEPDMPLDAQHSGESAAAAESNAASEAGGAAESKPGPDGETAPESSVSAESESAADSALDSESDSAADAETVAAESAARPKANKPATPSAGLTGGIGCAALLLPLIAVAGAVLCFAAGVLSTASGCSPNGSALCSANGAWYAFALPVFVSPLVAAAAAIGAVTVRRHRSTWLAVGYGIVFISIIIGLATASTGSH